MPVKLAFEALGEGPPVVILHGLFGAGRNWSPIAQALAGSCRVYLPDARNHGASPRAGTMSYTEMALDVLALIDSERLRRPIVIGHSMGGKTAMTLALEHPHAIGGVGVVDIAPEAYADQFSPYAAAMRDLDRHDERFDSRLHLMATALCMRDLCGFPEQLLRKHYPGPALFVAGERSDYVRPESRPAVVRLFPQARLQCIAGAGHWVHADEPEALLHALRGWLGDTVALPATR